MCGRIGQCCGGERSSPKRLARHWYTRHRVFAGVLLSVVWCAASSASQQRSASAQDAKLLTRMLREGHSVEARAGAATVIGHRRDAEQRPELEGALGDHHPTVRAAAASALGRIGSRSSLPPLHGVVSHDRVRDVVQEARVAIDTIEHQPDPEAEAAARSAKEKPRYGLILGEMRNRSRFNAASLPEILGHAIARNLGGLPGAAVFESEAQNAVAAAQEQGLTLFRLDGSVTKLSTSRTERQLSMHCEVALLLMDRPTGALRTLLKGAATGVEVPFGVPADQELSVARRVVDAAVRSALRNADPTIAEAARAD